MSVRVSHPVCTLKLRTVIRLVPLITTLFPKHLLKRPSVVAMPRQEIGRSMNRERLLDMRHNQIIVSTLRTCRDSSRSPCW
jgi:hypothetical protein